MLEQQRFLYTFSPCPNIKINIHYIHVYMHTHTHTHIYIIIIIIIITIILTSFFLYAKYAKAYEVSAKQNVHLIYKT